VFTKPLQGAAFVKFCKLILNLNDGDQTEGMPMDHRSLLKKKISWVSLFDTFFVLPAVIVQDFLMLSEKKTGQKFGKRI
jgi:hypothetical protein